VTIGDLTFQALAPITLSALDGYAALTTRVERKYVLARKEAEGVCAMLPREARVLEIGERRSFHYTSVYFDTPGGDAYRATACSRRRRFKVRTREYLDSGQLFVEVKTRQGRFTIKDREPYDCAERLTPDGAARVAEYLNTAYVSGIDTSTLAPALRTRFTRTTLYLPESRSRVTFDTDLSFSSSVGAGRGRTLEFPELTIVETKTPGLPSSLDRLLWSFGIRPMRFSKFGTGLAELHPELPHTKWARVMRTRLAAA
jgi:VTC domain-containing protein